MRTLKLFKLFALPVFLFALIITGCSKNDSVLGPNLNSQVSFQISQQTGNLGGTEFLFKPTVDTKVTRIISRYDAQQFADTITYTNAEFVYSKDVQYIINEYVGVERGQQWKFSFQGSIPGQNNSNYNVTVNYTVQ